MIMRSREAAVGYLPACRGESTHAYLLRVFFAAVLLAAVVCQAMPAGGQVPDLRERGPIYITSDADFTPANGVLGGLGTAESPFLIDGWTITGPALNPLPGPGSGGPNAAVEIRDTSAYFVISNLTLVAEDSYLAGISLFDLSHGSVRSNDLIGFDVAISAAKVTSTSITRNEVIAEAQARFPGEVASGTGIRVERSDGVLVASNDVSGNAGAAIEIYDNQNVTAIGNRVHDVTPGHNAAAIALFGGDARVIDNEVERYGGPEGGWGAIKAERMSDLDVSGNDITSTNATGRPVISATGERIVVIGNLVSSSHGASDEALFVAATERAEVGENVLVDSGGMQVRGGKVFTHDNHIQAGGRAGFSVYAVDEWTSRDDVITGVTRPADGSLPSSLLVLETNTVRVQGMRAHDNEVIGATFVGGDVEVDGITVEGNQAGGIQLQGVDRALFQNCTVRDNGGLAIRVTADGHGRESRHVDVEDCGVDVTWDTAGPQSPPEAPDAPRQDSPVSLAPALVVLVALVLSRCRGRRGLR